jgi:hypothetical protein
MKTIEFKIQRLNLIPSQAILYVVPDSPMANYELIWSDDFGPDLGPRRVIRPPSYSEWRNANQNFLVLIHLPGQRIGNMDPSMLHNNRILLKWQREAPRFHWDVEVFIWEKYKSLPANHCVHIWYQPNSERDTARLILLFGDSIPLEQFAFHREDKSIYFPANRMVEGQRWISESEVVLSLCALLKVIVGQTTQFTSDCWFEIQGMVCCILVSICIGTWWLMTSRGVLDVKDHPQTKFGTWLI